MQMSSAAPGRLYIHPKDAPAPSAAAGGASGAVIVGRKADYQAVWVVLLLPCAYHLAFTLDITKIFGYYLGASCVPAYEMLGW